jgi:hypothetical protein
METEKLQSLQLWMPDYLPKSPNQLYRRHWAVITRERRIAGAALFSALQESRRISWTTTTCPDLTSFYGIGYAIAALSKAMLRISSKRSTRRKRSGTKKTLAQLWLLNMSKIKKR